MLNFLRIFPIFPAVSAMVCAFIFVYMLIKGEKTLKLFSFELMVACLLLWSTGQFLEYSTKDLVYLSYYITVIHTAIVFIGPVSFVFSLYYTDSEFIYRYKKYLPFFFVIPVFAFLMLITNDFHELYYTLYSDPDSILRRVIKLGPLFFIIFFYNIALICFSIGVIFKNAMKNEGTNRKQMIFIALMMMIPVIINVGEMLLGWIIKWDDYPVDFTPMSFSFSCLFAFLAAFRYNFLDIMPIALKIVFNHMEHATVVYNQNGRLVKYNLSFDKLFKDYIDSDDEINTYQKFCNVLKILVEDQENVNVFIEEMWSGAQAFREEITLKSVKTSESKVYEMNIQSIFNSSKRILGKIVTLHEITRHKTLVEEINLKNSQLTDMNDKLLELNMQLNENMILTEKLAVSNERNRIARELHDSLGHTLMLVIMLMKSVKIEYDTNPYESKFKLSEAINIAEDGFREIKRLVNGILSDDIRNINVIYNLENLFNDVRILGVAINFSIIGEEYFNSMVESDRSFKITDAVYKICKEAITNSIRHGKATCVNVILKHSSDGINIYIIDNGTGCKQIKEGLGLMGMKERLKSVDGKLVYGSDGESGFNIHIRIPCRRE